ncbi:MAG: hypoxanthine phosphoribosyltransferase [Saprospiraceae bacterium]|nr:hypoxanthine phosphoribosyltransferase [Saprospiraceae bacterium]
MSNPIQLHDLHFKPMIGESDLAQRVQALGAAISADYAGKRPLLLGVLNGAFIFAADLARACSIDCEVSFIKLSSYKGTQSSGEINERIGLEIPVAQRHVILIEDIIDSGNTMAHFLPTLRQLHPASIAIATLLFKPEALIHPIHIDYLGFEIPNRFVVGYGLDYNGLGRNLPAIYQLDE